MLIPQACTNTPTEPAGVEGNVRAAHYLGHVGRLYLYIEHRGSVIERTEIDGYDTLYFNLPVDDSIYKMVWGTLHSNQPSTWPQNHSRFYVHKDSLHTVELSI